MIPVPISNTLARFLGRPAGTQMSHHEIRARLLDYARNNGLMDRYIIHADAPLRALMNITEADQVRVLNINKYLGHHCPLPGRRVPVASVVPIGPSVFLYRYELYDEPDARDLDAPDDRVI